MNDGHPLCLGCGRCCRFSIPVDDGEDVPEELLVEQRGQKYMRTVENSYCVALDPVQRRCTIYAKRPTVCRQYAVGGQPCLKMRGLDQ